MLHKIITRTMKLLTRRGVLVEEQGQTYVADSDGDSDEARTLEAAAGSRLALQAAPGQWPGPSPGTNSPLDCLSPGSAYRIAFGPRAGQKVLTLQGAALANERVQTKVAGQVVLKLKTPWRDGTTHLVISPLKFMQRLAALVPRPRLHLTRFHGVLAPNAKLRAQVVPQEPEPPVHSTAK